MVIGFCVKQKTAYEMRISDWSSDVCSSDLCVVEPRQSVRGHALRRAYGALFEPADRRLGAPDDGGAYADAEARVPGQGAPPHRSEERRVGTECVSTCTSRR